MVYFHFEIVLLLMTFQLYSMLIFLGANKISKYFNYCQVVKILTFRITYSILAII